MMQLRKSVASPDRFDETVFRLKKRDPTRPPYPELLAKQVIAFNPNNRPAVFPSTPLDVISCHDEMTCIADALEARLPNNQKPAFPAPCQEENGIIGTDVDVPIARLNKTIRVNTGTIGMARSKASDICETCHLKIRTEWQSLSLSVQVHIFNSCLNHQRYPEAVAQTLELTYQELETIEYQINLRKIHHAPLEDLWTYAAAKSGLGPNIVDPEYINEAMDYMLFASHYEEASVDEIELGKTFLKQRGLNGGIMDSFGKQAQFHSLHLETMTADALVRSPLKRRRSSTGARIMINAARANARKHRLPPLASAPANTTHFKHETEPSHCDTQEKNIDPSLIDTLTPRSSIVHDSEPNETLYRLKRMRLDIDDNGHASVSTDHRINENDLKDVSGHLTDLATIDVLMTNPLSTTRFEIHCNHNSRAFAAHFGHVTFPPHQRRRLLGQDPRSMQDVDHWLVYGTSWIFPYHRIEFGPVPQPLDKAFDPRKTMLNDDQMQSLVLRELANLHNLWVLTSEWEQGYSKDLVRKFDLIAETVMEKALELQIRSSKYSSSTGHSGDSAGRVATTANSVSPDHVYPSKSIVAKRESIDGNHYKDLRSQSMDKGALIDHEMDHPRETLVKPFVQDTLSVHQVLANISNQVVRSFRGPTDAVQHQMQGGAHVDEVLRPSTLPPTLRSSNVTPNDKATQQHSGDTTIDILGDTNSQAVRSVQHLIEPGSTRRQLFDCGIAQVSYGRPAVHPEEGMLKIPLTTTNNKPSVPRSNGIKLSHSRPPSFSPLSDQDPESIPLWARCFTTARTTVTDESSASYADGYRLPLKRPTGAGLHSNVFLQDILDAAGHEILDHSAMTNAQLNSAKPRWPPNEGQSDVSDRGAETIASNTRPASITLNQQHALSNHKGKLKQPEIRRSAGQIETSSLMARKVENGQNPSLRRDASKDLSGLDTTGHEAAKVSSFPTPTKIADTTGKLKSKPTRQSQPSKPQLQRKSITKQTTSTQPSKSRRTVESSSNPKTDKLTITPVTTRSGSSTTTTKAKKAPDQPIASTPGTKKRRSDFGRKRGSYKKRNHAVQGAENASHTSVGAQANVVATSPVVDAPKSVSSSVGTRKQKKGATSR